MSGKAFVFENVKAIPPVLRLDLLLLLLVLLLNLLLPLLCLSQVAGGVEQGQVVLQRVTQIVAIAVRRVPPEVSQGTGRSKEPYPDFSKERKTLPLLPGNQHDTDTGDNKVF